MFETFKDDMSVLCPLFVHFSLILSLSLMSHSSFVFHLVHYSIPAFFSFGISLIKIRSNFVVDYNGRASEGMAGLSDR